MFKIRYTFVTIAAMMALGYITRYCGLDATLGLAFARTGALYPFFGTLIGWLGTASTGSDTSSNVLFGSLQVITARQIGVSPMLMASANSAGGVMGKMIDAASIVVASTATNTYGQEGSILRFVFFHSLALAALAGIAVTLLAYVPSSSRPSSRTDRCALVPRSPHALTPHKRWGAPGLDSQTWDRTTPQQCHPERSEGSAVAFRSNAACCSLFTVHCSLFSVLCSLFSVLCHKIVPHLKRNPMTTFNPQRRDLLRVGSLGVAGAAIPAISFAAAKTGDAPESGSTSAPGLGVFFNVHAYGAVGDGKTVHSPAIKRARDAASSAGGGMVLFPAGIYLCFSIRLKSNVHLHLEQGATILAADSPKPGDTTGYNGGTFDAAEPNESLGAVSGLRSQPLAQLAHLGEWTSTTSPSPALASSTEKASSFGAGPGVAATSTEVRGFFTEPVGHPGANGQSTPAQPVRHFDPRGDHPMFQAEQPGVANKAVALKNCHNVELRDFSILKGGHFGLLLTGVDNLIIDNLTIDTDRDGMDIDCCQNVRVSNCTAVNSPWDDGICPKSSYSLGYARATRNVTIANCFVTGCYQLVARFSTARGRNSLKAAARTAPAASSAAQSPMAASSTSPSPDAYSKAVRATRLKPSTARAAREDITISNTTMRDIISGAAVHASRRPTSRAQRYHQGRHAQAHPRQ